MNDVELHDIYPYASVLVIVGNIPRGNILVCTVYNTSILCVYVYEAQRVRVVEKRQSTA